MWGNGVANPADAIQGQLGNCWLIVAAMSVAEDPDRIYDIFEIKEKNSFGMYATQMWLLGMPITVTIDDYLPVEKTDNQKTRYANVGKDGSLWGPILEKSFAKYYGNYEAINSSQASIGIEGMIGSPSEDFDHPAIIKENRGEELWQSMLKADSEGKMITCGSFTGTGSDQDSNENGLPNNHAFSIMRVLTVTDSAGKEHRLVEMRNPWGFEKYQGDWSNSSKLWTEDLLKQAGDHSLVDDGKYFMSFEDYLSQIEYTSVN